MVKFILKDQISDSSIKLDVPGDEDIGEVFDIANEYWGVEEIILRNGYDLVRLDCAIDDEISDGDVVEVVAVPFDIIFQ